MSRTLTWFEVPATDVDRAVAFYETVVGLTIERNPDDPCQAFFSHTDSLGGEICSGPFSQPGGSGVLVYFDVTGGVADALTKVEAAGGAILTPLTDIGPHGFIAVVEDTEGNRVGLHNIKG